MVFISIFHHCLAGCVRYNHPQTILRQLQRHFLIVNERNREEWPVWLCLAWRKEYRRTAKNSRQTGKQQAGSRRKQLSQVKYNARKEDKFKTHKIECTLLIKLIQIPRFSLHSRLSKTTIYLLLKVLKFSVCTRMSTTMMHIAAWLILSPCVWVCLVCQWKIKKTISLFISWHHVLVQL